MAKPITIIYPAFGSQNDADKDFAGFPMLDETRQMLPGAAADAEFPTADLKFRTWWVTDSNLAKSLALGDISGRQLPQLLFTTPDPNGTGGELLVLAKLVKGQITRQNIATMLKTVGRLKKKTNPDGKQGFYDPTLQIPLSSIGFNPASAPGGWLIGLNPTTYKVELSRYGQQLEEFLGGKLPLFLLLGIGALILLSKDDK